MRGRGLQRERKRVLEAEPYCRHCTAKGLSTIATEVDHVTPLYKGGKDERSNRQPLCHDCHKAKTYRDAHGTDKPKPIRAPDW